MEENSDKNGQLKAVILLLIGFIAGFATYAFSISGESTVSSDSDNTEEELVKEGELSNEEIATSSEISEIFQKENEISEKEETDIYLKTTPNTLLNEGYSFSVTDQSAGGVVYVSHLVFAKDAWVAVREDDNGQLGNVLGAHWYPAGEHSGAIELLRNTQPEKKYYVVIYVDNGDKKFDFKKDALLVNESGDATASIFRAY